MATKEPLKYEASKHQPMSGDDTIPPARIPLSGDTGNLIEIRDDGVFYGLAAPPNIATLYVSPSLGDDDNPGTRAEPLATIVEAVTRHENRPVTYRIILRAGETHDMLVSAPDRSAAKVEFWWYDDPIHLDFNTPRPSCFAYSPSVADDLDRPVVRFHRVEAGTRVTTSFAYAQINYNGIELSFTDDAVGSVLPDGGDSINRITTFRSETRFVGCVINTPSYGGAIFRQCDVFYLNTTINGDTTGLYYILNEIISTNYSNLGSHGPCGTQPGYTAITSNIDSVIDAASFADLRSDAPTKRTFNAIIGWDIFP
jgi:hypothetical protein